MTIFGERLRKKRKEQRLSQRELAIQLGMDVSYLCLIENGRRNPSQNFAPVLAHFLGITPSEVIQLVNGEKTRAQAEQIKEVPLLSTAVIEAQAYEDREKYLYSVGRDEFKFPKDRDRIAWRLCQLEVREDDTLFGANNKRIYAGLFPGDYRYEGQAGVIVVATKNVRKDRPENTSEQSKLFHVFHEIGHFFLHWPRFKDKRSVLPMGEPRFCSSGDRSPIELQANAYADAFLMPRFEVFRLLDNKRTFYMRRDGRVLCEHFFVEPWTLRLRLKKLGINVVD